jgi:hypothetical protein
MAILVSLEGMMILACQELLACAAAKRHRDALWVVGRPWVDPTVPTWMTVEVAGS